MISRKGSRVLACVALGLLGVGAPPGALRAASSINLFIRAVEVVQAAQDRANGFSGAYVGLPLVGGKGTVVRIHADLTGASGAVPGVSAVLRGFSGGVELPGSPLAPSAGSLELNPADDFFARRRDQRKTFNFPLPLTWTTGTISLEAQLNPAGEIEEIPGGETDNVLEVTDVVFRPVPELPIKAVPVSIDGSAPPDEKVLNTFSFPRMAYPVSAISVVESPTSLTIASPTDCGSILGKLAKSFAISSTDKKTLVYGVLPFGLDCAGMAYLPGRHAIGHGFLPDRGWVAAQEIGHNFGLDHAGDSHGEGSSGPWPYYHGGFGVVFEGRGPEGAGFVPARMLAMPATAPFVGFPDCEFDAGDDICQVGATGVGRSGPTDHAHDFMSYGGAPTWISSLTWQRLFDKLSSLKVEAPEAVSAAHGWLIVEGAFDAWTDRVRARPFYVVADAAETPAGDTGDFLLELQDESGTVLASRRFDPVAPTHCEAAERTFLEVLPFDPAVARIVIKRRVGSSFRHRETVLVSRKVPKVRLLSPKTAEVWSSGESETIRWAANDPDSRRLFYAVLYSSDGGETWSPLGIDLTETSLTVDPAHLAGSNKALLRVIVTDGVNTSSVESPTAFAVDPKPPAAVILAPGNGARFQRGVIVPLAGAGLDREDGTLSGAAFDWASDRDGPLGTGRQVDAAELSAGTHVIALTVTDSHGLTATVSITVTIDD